MEKGTFLGWKVHAAGFRHGQIKPDRLEADLGNKITVIEGITDVASGLKKGVRVEFEFSVENGRLFASKVRVLPELGLA